MASEVATQGTPRDQALLKAINLDRVPPEQRELALAIAESYGLDLMLKHLVLVEGRPYITRDGLLHVAHRSGALDGIEVTDPELVDLPGVGQFWRARCSVYRKDMSRPFVYMGRYPAKGGNVRFAPEMVVKVAEVMALRRAFDVSAPVIEERWDIDTTAPAEPPATVTETIAARRAAITSGPAPLGPQGAGTVEEARPTLPPPPEEPVRDDPQGEPPLPAVAPDAIPEPEPGSAFGGNPTTAPTRCDGFSPELGPCRRAMGHTGNHANKDRESWA